MAARRRELDPVRAEVLGGGLPSGSPAPDFALADLSGRERALESRRGLPLLLVFFDPACTYCRELLPELARLDPDPAHGLPLTVLVAAGDRGEVRALVSKHEVRCPVLLQDTSGVAEWFSVPATPAAYVVDANGLISSTVVLGD